jgi:hypothetical protein
VTTGPVSYRLRRRGWPTSPAGSVPSPPGRWRRCRSPGHRHRRLRPRCHRRYPWRLTGRLTARLTVALATVRLDCFSASPAGLRVTRAVAGCARHLGRPAPRCASESPCPPRPVRPSPARNAEETQSRVPQGVPSDHDALIGQVGGVSPGRNWSRTCLRTGRSARSPLASRRTPSSNRRARACRHLQVGLLVGVAGVAEQEAHAHDPAEPRLRGWLCNVDPGHGFWTPAGRSLAGSDGYRRTVRFRTADLCLDGTSGAAKVTSSVSANGGNRCARSRSPRLAPTVDAEGKRSLDVQLDAPFRPPRRCRGGTRRSISSDSPVIV